MTRSGPGLRIPRRPRRPPVLAACPGPPCLTGRGGGDGRGRPAGAAGERRGRGAGVPAGAGTATGGLSARPAQVCRRRLPHVVAVESTPDGPRGAGGDTGRAARDRDGGCWSRWEHSAAPVVHPDGGAHCAGPASWRALRLHRTCAPCWLPGKLAAVFEVSSLLQPGILITCKRPQQCSCGCGRSMWPHLQEACVSQARAFGQPLRCATSDGHPRLYSLHFRPHGNPVGLSQHGSRSTQESSDLVMAVATHPMATECSMGAKS